jgi:hypothetical protein
MMHVTLLPLEPAFVTTRCGRFTERRLCLDFAAVPRQAFPVREFRMNERTRCSPKEARIAPLSADASGSQLHFVMDNRPIKPIRQHVSGVLVSWLGRRKRAAHDAEMALDATVGASGRHLAIARTAAEQARLPAVVYGPISKILFKKLTKYFQIR